MSDIGSLRGYSPTVPFPSPSSPRNTPLTSTTKNQGVEDGIIVELSNVAKTQSSGSLTLSSREVEQIVDAFLRLEPEHDTLLLGIARELDYSGRQTLYAAVMEADQHASDLLIIGSELEKEDLLPYLKAARGAGDAIPAFIKTVDRLGDKETIEGPDSGLRTAYIERAASLRGQDRIDFITASEDLSDQQLRTFIDLSNQLDEEPLSDFLGSATHAGGIFDDFLSRSGEAIENRQYRFLMASRKAGEELSTLYTLEEKITSTSRNRFLRLAEEMSDQETSNFLKTTESLGFRPERLMELSDRLGPKSRGLFLELAASTSEPIPELMSFTEGMLDQGDNLQNFLLAANKDATRTGTLMKLTLESEGNDRQRFLSIAKDLSGVDLANFLEATDQAGSSLMNMVSMTEDLDGRNRSLFLHASSHTDGQDQQRIMDQVQILEMSDLDNFLVSIANAEPGEQFNSLLRRTENLAGAERSSFLAEARIGVTLAQGSHEAENIFMTTVLDQEEMEDFLTAASYAQDEKEEKRLRQAVDSSSDRTLFLEVAAKAGPTLGSLLDATEQSGQSSVDALLGLGETMKPANLRNLLTAAHNSNNTELDRLVSLASSFNGSTRDDFLAASANAGKKISSFLDSVEAFPGRRISLYLAVAESLGTNIELLDQATDGFYQLAKNKVMQSADEVDFQFDRLFSRSEDPITGQVSYSMPHKNQWMDITGVLFYAASQSDPGHLRDYLDSFTKPNPPRVS